MRHLATRLAALTVVAAASIGLAADGQEGAKTPVREGPRVLDPRHVGIGALVADVGFTDLDGETGKLSDYRGKTLVVLARSVTCPLCRKYGPRLREIAAEFGERGVAFLVLGVAEHDSADDLLADRKKTGIQARWIADPERRIAAALGVRSTTDAFVLDGARTLVYRGAVDDQYGFGYALPAPRREYLRFA